MSAEPDSASVMATPVPTATKLTVIQGYVAWKESLMSSLIVVPLAKTSGWSSSPVS